VLSFCGLSVNCCGSHDPFRVLGGFGEWPLTLMYVRGQLPASDPYLSCQAQFISMASGWILGRFAGEDFKEIWEFLYNAFSDKYSQKIVSVNMNISYLIF